MDPSLKRRTIDEDSTPEDDTLEVYKLEDGIHEDNIAKDDIHEDDKLDVDKLQDGTYEDNIPEDDINEFNKPENDIHEDGIQEDNIIEDDIYENDLADEDTSEDENPSDWETVDDSSESDSEIGSSESRTDVSSESSSEEDLSELDNKTFWKIQKRKFSKSCKKELKKIKRNKLIQQLMQNTQRPYFLANPDTVTELEKVLNSQELHISGRFLLLKLEWSMKRLSLLTSAIKILSNDVFASLNLPELVVREVVEYLEDEELEILCGEVNND